jgi:hypothetical protein
VLGDDILVFQALFAFLGHGWLLSQSRSREWDERPTAAFPSTRGVVTPTLSRDRSAGVEWDGAPQGSFTTFFR